MELGEEHGMKQWQGEILVFFLVSLVNCVDIITLSDVCNRGLKNEDKRIKDRYKVKAILEKMK